MNASATPQLSVAVICGGSSYERAVSLRSGAAVADALHELGHTVTELDSGPSLAGELRAGSFDVAFIALHGKGGEDGHVQGLLELIGIPYTGSQPGPSQCAYEKARAKRMLRAAGVPTPEFVSLTQTALQDFGAADALTDAAELLGFPVVVKPASGGSAMGVRIVRDAAELPRAIMHAMSFDGHIIIEQAIAGREIAVCVLGTEDPTVLPPIRIVPRYADHFDFESRYTRGETEYTCPPDDLTEDELARVEAVALTAYEALDLSGYGRVDMIIDADGIPQVLELESVPGMTDTSLLPMAAAAAGMSLAAVVETLLADAIAGQSAQEHALDF